MTVALLIWNASVTLFCAIGWDRVLRWLCARLYPYGILGGVLFVVLAVVLAGPLVGGILLTIASLLEVLS